MTQQNIAALTLSLAITFNLAAVWGEKSNPVSEQDVRKIENAIPGKARVKPAKPRKLLVFTLSQGFYHGSVPYAAKALEIMGAKTGAFSATVSDDIAVFEPETLQQFDAVCMDNTTMRVFGPKDLNKLPPEAKKAAQERDTRLKKSLLDFVRNGKGIVGIHAATDCFYQWAEFGEMIGGYFWGHPWHEKVAVKLDDPGHPLCRAFKGMNFPITDEIYQFRDPYSRKKLRVLLSLDTANTNMDKGDSIRRKDGDFAVSWIRSYGKGRAFFCSLGHRSEIFWNPMILQYYLDGIQFALGDMPADTTPSAELSEAYLRRSREESQRLALNDSFKEIAEYKLGGDNTSLKLIAERVIQTHGNPQERNMLQERLISLLESKATADGKRFACRQLFIMGTDEAVPALAKLLTNRELADMALYGLERMATPAAGRALREALAKVDGSSKVGVINSLGERREGESTPALAALLGDGNPAVVRAAAAALGKIGGAKAIEALEGVRPKVASELRPAISHALLNCADQMLTTQREKALPIYEALYSSDEPKSVRVAAFVGLARVRRKDALPLVISALAGDDPDLPRAAIRFVREMPGEAATKAFAEQLSKSSAAVQTMLIYALADRGDPLALPAVAAGIGSDEESVRLAALRAMSALGDASVVERLVEVAANAEFSSNERTAARMSLNRLRGQSIDAALQACIGKADVPARTEAIRRLESRRAVAAVPSLLEVATRDDDKSVRIESLKALATLGTENDLPALVDIVAAKQEDDERSEAERVVATVALKIPDENRRCDVVLAAMNKAPAAAQCSLLRCLGLIGSPQGLDALQAALKHENKEIQEAAIRSLSRWPNSLSRSRIRQTSGPTGQTSGPIDMLFEVAENSSSPAHRVIALRGYARLIGLPSDRPSSESLKLYEKGLKLAMSDEERKLLLAGLGNVHHPGALKLAESYFDDKALQSQAVQAAAKIYHAVRAPKAAFASLNSNKARNAVDGDMATRWDTGRPQQGGEWYVLDLGYEQEIHKITLDAGSSRGDYPRGYEVYVSNNKDDLGEPVANGKGKTTVVDIEFERKVGRYIKIVQTGADRGLFWSIHEMKINDQPAARGAGKEISDRSGWKISASVGNEDAKNAVDGNMETRWGTLGSQKKGQWLMVDLGVAKKIYKIVLDAGRSRNDYPRGYSVYVSKDGEDWGIPLASGRGKRGVTVIPVYPKFGRYIKIVQTRSARRWWWSVYDLEVFAE